MSLYDDDVMDSSATTGSAKASVDDKGSANISFKFLQAQIAQKRTNLQQAKNHVAPVIDLSGRSKPINMRPMRPVKAVPILDSAPLSFLPKSAIEDNVLLFGEIVVTGEYQPSVPNDYLTHKRRRDEREAREKAAREIAERLDKEHKEEAKKREKGAAIAPPQALIEEPPAPTTSMAPPPSFLPTFGKATTKGLGIAANIMSKFGYREGSGLGRTEQGMSKALSVERVGRNAGVIVGDEAFKAPAGVPSTVSTNITEQMKNSSRILLLTDMVGVDDVDDELEPEIKEEMSKYGQVTSIKIHVIDGAPDDEAVRIFVEFTNVAQAIKAFVVMNGRFFGGRSVKARFYNLDEFNQQNYTAL